MNYKDIIADFGNNNGWKGYVGLYLTKKQLREMKRLYGITEDDTIKSAFYKIR